MALCVVCVCVCFECLNKLHILLFYQHCFSFISLQEEDETDEEHLISKLKVSTRGGVWKAFFVREQAWFDLEGQPKEKELERAVLKCRRASNRGLEVNTPKGAAIPSSVSAKPIVSTVESHGPRLHDGSLHSTTGFCGTNAVLLGLGGVLTPQQQADFSDTSLPYMLLEELADLMHRTTKHSLVHYIGSISTQLQFENKIMEVGGNFLCSPLLHDGTSNHLVFIDADKKILYDPAHESSKTGVGIDMSRRAWIKEIPEWKTWNLVDVRLVVATASLNGSVLCACGKSVPESQMQVHVSGRKHRAAMNET